MYHLQSVANPAEGPGCLIQAPISVRKEQHKHDSRLKALKGKGIRCTF